MKLKKYWKIILSLCLILSLAIVAICNIKITKPEDNELRESVLAEGSNDFNENNEDFVPSNEDEVVIENSPDSQKAKDSEAATLESDNEDKAEGSKSETGSVKEEASDKNSTNETSYVAEKKSSAAVQTDSNKTYCSFSIDCYTVLNNKGNLKSGKEKCLGDNGLIFSGNVEAVEGESVKDLLLDVCRKNNIKVSYKGDYITGINNLMEKDCGKLSGWMYSVNGVYPMKSVGVYKIKSKDVIKFRYTCRDCGGDLK